MKQSDIYKKILPDLIVVAGFMVISFIYFASALIDGRVIAQHDSLAAVGQGQEQRDYMERHNGERTRWNISMFSGMPSYQMSPTYNSTKPINKAKQIWSLFLPDYVSLLFIMLLGFYILMRAFKASPLIAALGAIAWSFSSYFFILISAGHIWKFITLAYIPPTIAGMVYIYRKKYLPGGLLFMIFVAFQISANHFQMSYYFLFVMFFLLITFFVDSVKKKELPHFFKSSGILLIAGLIGVAANASSLYHTREYSKETMRGKSELTHHEDPADITNDGLERSYITAWSYGTGETWTLLIPNCKGGTSSQPMSENQLAMSKAKPEYSQIYQQLGQYWGEQPGTSGPVYVGAFLLTLFVLGLFIVKSPIKWALLGGTAFSILLAWGQNYMVLTNFFIDWIPLYNKFRAVSSILVIAEFTIPLLAALAVKELIKNPDSLKKNIKALYISLGLTGGVALLFAVLPKLFFSSFISTNEIYSLTQALPPEHVKPLMDNLTEMRLLIFTSDAWRSVIIVAVGAILLLLYMNNKKFKANYLLAGLILLCLFDMWSVNKRYLNDDNFIDNRSKQQQFVKSAADEIILEDSNPYYRVLNLATSPFNDGITPYHHKTIGGYHAAKLRRYQDLIDIHISNEIDALQQEILDSVYNAKPIDGDRFKVLNMLNTRWVIMPGQGGNIPISNPYAMGNVWFLDNIFFVDGADEEINSLSDIDLRREAVADRIFEPVLENFKPGFKPSPADSASTINMVEYDSNYLLYQVDAKKDELALFSEVYYPKGWRITIDGEPAEMLRANYTMRAMPIPEGKHIVKFIFDPISIKVTDNIAYAAIFLMLIAALYYIYKMVARLRKSNSEGKSLSV